MTIPFFLTKQAANLMEDLARELSDGSGMYLLYGDKGIGKTRLLQELQRSRLNDRRIHWIDLKSGDDDDTESKKIGGEFIRIAEAAESGDIIIADHFERASDKARHQLFQCWVALGADKKLNFIISSAIHGFNDLRQLALQYKVRVQSFQQMPFSREEVDAFIGYYLYPDIPLGPLTMPVELRMQLTNVGGNVGKVVEIVNRSGAQIQLSPISEVETRGMGGWMISTLVVLPLVLVMVIWYLNTSPETIEAQPSAGTRNSVVRLAQSQVDIEAESEAAAEAKAAAKAKAVADAKAAAKAKAVAEAKAAAKAKAVAEAKAAAKAKAVADAKAAAKAKAVAEAKAAAKAKAVAEVKAAAKAKAVAEEKAAAKAKAVAEAKAAAADEAARVIKENNENTGNQLETASLSIDNAGDRLLLSGIGHSPWFQAEMSNSLEWLKQSQRVQGTIQIMWIGSDSFADNSYRDYINGLKNRNIDISQVRIFQVTGGKAIIYNVFYGKYANRKAANKAVAGLPKVLRANLPFGRTVGGIRNEIKQ